MPRLVLGESCTTSIKDFAIVPPHEKKEKKRLSEFRAFQIFFDLKTQKMLYPNQTRWLSILPAIIHVRNRYLALKLYFNGEQLNPKDGEKSSARAIHLLLINPINKLYLDFLRCHPMTAENAKQKTNSQLQNTFKKKEI